MKKIVSILIGSLCAFTFCVNAEEITVEGPTPATSATTPSDAASSASTDATAAQVLATEDVAPAAASEAISSTIAVDAGPAAVDMEQKEPPKAKKKASWWDMILKLFKVSDPARTSEQALNDMMKSPNVVIDFSNVSDFAQNGEAKMTEYYQKIKATKSFGSKSPNLYVNLSKTGVSTEFIAKWAGEFAKDKKNVIWNLSDNPNLDDSVIDALDLPSIYSLNLSGTSVTDAGITKIGAMLEANGIGRLVCIHLSGSKVTDAGVEALKASMQKAVEAWKAKNSGKEFKLQGTNDSGVVFEKIPALPKRPALKKPGATQNVPAENASPEKIEQIAEEASTPEAVQAEPSIPETTNAAIEAVNEAQNVAQAKNPVPNSSVEGEAAKALNEANALVSLVQPEETKQAEMPELPAGDTTAPAV